MKRMGFCTHCASISILVRWSFSWEGVYCCTVFLTYFILLDLPQKQVKRFFPSLIIKCFKSEEQLNFHSDLEVWIVLKSEILGWDSWSWYFFLNKIVNKAIAIPMKHAKWCCCEDTKKKIAHGLFSLHLSRRNSRELNGLAVI